MLIHLYVIGMEGVICGTVKLYHNMQRGVSVIYRTFIEMNEVDRNKTWQKEHLLV